MVTILPANRLPVWRIPSDRFTWTGNKGCAEASDLRGFPGQQVYRDAADLGFEVESLRTGTVRLFVYSEDVLDANGEDLVARRYVSVDGPRGQTGNVVIDILND